jgi:hypothetical protein
MLGITALEACRDVLSARDMRTCVWGKIFLSYGKLLYLFCVQIKKIFVIVTNVTKNMQIIFMSVTVAFIKINAFFLLCRYYAHKGKFIFL